MNSFINHINNIKEMITYFKDKNNKSKKIYKKYKTMTTKLKSFDTSVNIATTSTSITLSVTGIGLIAIAICCLTASCLSISNKVIYELIMNNSNKYKKEYEKYQQTIKSFDKLHRKLLQDNVIDKNEYESQCNFFIKYVDETKNESVL